MAIRLSFQGPGTPDLQKSSPSPPDPSPLLPTLPPAWPPLHPKSLAVQNLEEINLTALIQGEFEPRQCRTNKRSERHDILLQKRGRFQPLIKGFDRLIKMNFSNGLVSTFSTVPLPGVPGGAGRPVPTEPGTGTRDDLK